jgi:hypothetical protein
MPAMSTLPAQSHPATAQAQSRQLHPGFGSRPQAGRLLAVSTTHCLAQALPPLAAQTVSGGVQCTDSHPQALLMVQLIK